MKTLDLVASENIFSPFMRVFQLSRYSEQYYLSNERYAQPAQSPYPFDSLWPEILNEGKTVLNSVFGSDWADPRPLSGTHAMNCLLAGLTSPGDRIVISPESIGGHFATEFMAKRLGLEIYYNEYNPTTYGIDAEKSYELIKKVKPKLVALDVSHQLFPHPVSELRKLCGDDVIISFDASHTMGLIAGGTFQKPLDEGADLVHGSTHKTFPGPQKGLFIGRSERLKKEIDVTLFPRFCSNYHLHHVLALFAAGLEAKFFGNSFAKQIIANAQALAAELHKLGIPVMGEERGFTQSHQVWINLPAEYVVKLNQAGIRLTSFILPYSGSAINPSPQKGIRLGLACLTRMGMVEADMVTVAQFIASGIRGTTSPVQLHQNIQEFVTNFTGMKYHFSNLFQVETIGGRLGRLMAELLRKENLEPVFDHLVAQYQDKVRPIPLFLYSKSSNSTG